MSVLFPMCMFFMSYIPLWISILFIDIESILEKSGPFFTEYASIVSIIFAILVSIIVITIQLRRQSAEGAIKHTIESVTEQKAISAEYLLSYILPLFAFDFTYWRDVVLFLLFFITLAFLLLRHNYLSVNIALEFCGYRFYQCHFKSQDGIDTNRLILTKKQLNGLKNETIYIKHLTNDFSLDIAK